MYLLRSSATSVAVCTREIRTFTKSKSDTPKGERERALADMYVVGSQTSKFTTILCVCVCVCRVS